MSIEKELEERLTALEMRYSFQESTIEQLNGEILRQQTQIKDLTRRIKEIAGQVVDEIDGKESEKPPHY